LTVGLRKPGRPTDHDKREAIVTAARALMAKRGFDFSVEDVARDASVARQTVYNIYAGKEALVRAIVEQVLDDMVSPLQQGSESADIEVTLTGLALRYLDMILVPDKLAMMRAFMSQGSLSKGFGSLFYSIGPGVMRDRLAGYLERQQAAGQLRLDHPLLTADLFLSMIAGTRQLRALLAVPEPTELGTTADRVRLAVKMFLQGHRAAA
jgi:TetR/AcrR family transcriptional regulator, mexJK operon transcriptional repressor